MKIIQLPDAWRARAMVIRDVELSRDAFSVEELAIIDAFPLQKRRDEWMRARLAARLLKEGPFVSYSHSGPYGAAAIGHEPVGIDVEVVRPVADAGAHLFLSDEEHQAARRCAIEHPLLHFWCAKEAAWKQRQGTIPTLKQLPLRLVEERADGLRFDLAETVRIEDAIIALTF